MKLYDRQAPRSMITSVSMGAHEWLNFCHEQGIVPDWSQRDVREVKNAWEVGKSAEIIIFPIGPRSIGHTAIAGY